MGEANRRGNYAMRKAIAITRQKKIDKARLIAKIKAERAMTPEQREARKQRNLMAAQWLGVAFGGDIYSNFLNPFK